MDLRQLSSLLIKIAGLVIIIFAITGIPGYINSYLYQENGTLLGFFVFTIIPLIFPLIIGSLMWKFPNSITNKIIEAEGDLSTNKQLLSELERIAMTILGLILLFYGLSDLIYNFAYVYSSNSQNQETLSTFKVSPENWGHILGTFVEIIFSLFLLFKSKGLLKLLNKIRG